MTTPLRKSARLQQGDNCNVWSESIDTSTRRLLPSPSSSASFGHPVGDGDFVSMLFADA